MDQHPIPQDVTGFQFKLIGSMTVKQFGFVAAGVIMAVILYYLPIKGWVAFPVKMVLIPLFGVGGVLVAFMPIEGRPADVMAANFAKALFSPNQYVYRRQGRQFTFSKIADAAPQTEKQVEAKQAAEIQKQQRTANARGARLEAFLLENAHTEVRNKLDEKEVAFFKNISTIATPPVPATMTTPAHPASNLPPIHPTLTPPVMQPTPPTTIPNLQAQPAIPQSPGQTQPKPTAEGLGKEEAALEQQLAAAKQEETATPPTNASNAHQKVLDLEKKIDEIHKQKQQVEQELLQAKEQLATIKNDPAPAAPTLQDAQPHVRVVPEAAQRSAGLPHIPDTPNVVVGIVKDPRGNILNNILVEIKDKDGNPVRAFKTNPLGQFASATPLATGIYTIELEDPKKQNSFDVIQLVANNQILLPLEIISHDAREELRKQLFN